VVLPARALFLALIAALPANLAYSADFSYYPPGTLLPATSGQGRIDRRIYAPGIEFPIKLGSADGAFANSQVYRPGGQASGSQCSLSNYAMPWTDNFCEKRDWDMPLCPTGKGHQGQDIRPPTCKAGVWESVAVEDGVVASTNSNTSSVLVLGRSGTIYQHLHMDPATFAVHPRDQVRASQTLGRIANFMNGGPNTTIHLHFAVQQTVAAGSVARRIFVPPYTSLINAYRQLNGLPSINSGGQLGVDPMRELRPPP
jgi:murein DD-endopeptidase MepM/ murein hydrolase activator NlpD